MYSAGYVGHDATVWLEKLSLLIFLKIILQWWITF